MRKALGASRGRLVRQLLLETLAIAAGGRGAGQPCWRGARRTWSRGTRRAGSRSCPACASTAPRSCSRRRWRWLTGPPGRPGAGAPGGRGRRGHRAALRRPGRQRQPERAAHAGDAGDRRGDAGLRAPGRRRAAGAQLPRRAGRRPRLRPGTPGRVAAQPQRGLPVRARAHRLLRCPRRPRGGGPGRRAASASWTRRPWAATARGGSAWPTDRRPRTRPASPSSPTWWTPATSRPWASLWSPAATSPETTSRTPSRS